jgi:membrane protein DedA with SNARE-associated domain
MQSFLTALDRYTDNVQLFVTHHIVLAPLLLLCAEEMGLPILVPGDAILGYVGYALDKSHTATLTEAFIFAVVAVLGGATVLFFVARRFGRPLLDKLSRFIFLPQRHLDRVEKLFGKYGIWAIIFGRHIPGFRVPITIFAAVSGIKYRVFILGTFISTTAWVLFYLSFGKRYGADIQHTIQKYADLSIALIIAIAVAIIGLHIWGVYRERRTTH